MCSVSMVIEGWRHPTWPDPFNPVPIPGIVPSQLPGANAIPWPMVQTDPTLAAQMLEIIQRLEKIDKRLGTLEQCLVSEPEKKKLKSFLRKVIKTKK